MWNLFAKSESFWKLDTSYILNFRNICKVGNIRKPPEIHSKNSKYLTLLKLEAIVNDVSTYELFQTLKKIESVLKIWKNCKTFKTTLAVFEMFESFIHHIWKIWQQMFAPHNCPLFFMENIQKEVEIVIINDKRRAHFPYVRFSIIYLNNWLLFIAILSPNYYPTNT